MGFPAPTPSNPQGSPASHDPEKLHDFYLQEELDLQDQPVSLATDGQVRQATATILNTQSTVVVTIPGGGYADTNYVAIVTLGVGDGVGAWTSSPSSTQVTVNVEAAVTADQDILVRFCHL